MKRIVRSFVALGVCALVLGLVPRTAFAAEDMASEAGIGALAAISSAVYGPVKVAYAVGGAVVGGVAWVFSAGDNDVSMPIWNRSVRGDYVITPGNLRGEEPLEFIGRDPDPRYTPPSSNESGW